MQRAAFWSFTSDALYINTKRNSASFMRMVVCSGNDSEIIMIYFLSFFFQIRLYFGCLYINIEWSF